MVTLLIDVSLSEKNFSGGSDSSGDDGFCGDGNLGEDGGFGGD
jgi:hypothetical protein